jgi:hypothetical protein
MFLFGLPTNTVQCIPKLDLPMSCESVEDDWLVCGSVAAFPRCQRAFLQLTFLFNHHFVAQASKEVWAFPSPNNGQALLQQPAVGKRKKGSCWNSSQHNGGGGEASKGRRVHNEQMETDGRLVGEGRGRRSGDTGGADSLRGIGQKRKEPRTTSCWLAGCCQCQMFGVAAFASFLPPIFGIFFQFRKRHISVNHFCAAHFGRSALGKATVNKLFGCLLLLLTLLDTDTELLYFL